MTSTTKILATGLLVLAGLVPIMAQDVKSNAEADKPTISVSGFVKAEGMYDTRQIVEAREGYLLLYPKNVKLDKNGKDINAKGSFNQYDMMARFTAKITGPNVLGAKTMALIEGDFTGASESENNSFRLRHAYIKLKWNHAGVIAGQYWHPTNVPEMIPNVLALNTGAPFHPFSRQPLIQANANWGKFNALFAIISQRDYMDKGPALAGTPPSSTPIASTTYMRNSILPNLHAQVQYVSPTLFAGAGIDFKRLTPRIVTDSNYATKNAVNCLSYMAFAMVKTKPMIVKMQVIYGQGLNEHLVMGGYAVTHTDPLTNQQDYSALNYLSTWVNVQTTGKTWQGSIFAGYTKGYGCKDEVKGPVYARDADIAYVYRVSPMVSYISGKLTLAAECEYTVAAYGKPDSKYVVQNSSEVANTRLSFSIGYSF